MCRIYLGGVVLGEGTQLSLGAPSVSHPKKLTASALVRTVVQPTEGRVAPGEPQTWSLTKVQALALLLLNPGPGLKAHFLSVSFRHKAELPREKLSLRGWPASSLLLARGEGSLPAQGPATESWVL